MGLSGNQHRSTQRSGLVLEAFSPSASRKSILKYPLKSPVPLYSLPNTKRRKSPQCGQQCCGGDGKSPCPAHGILVPFAPGFVLKRPRLIKRGRNNGNILFPSQGTVQRLPHLWRPCQHHLPQCGCLMWDFFRVILFGCSCAVTGLALPAPISVKSLSAALTYRNVLSSLILGWRHMESTLAITAISTQKFLTFMTSYLTQFCFCSLWKSDSSRPMEVHHHVSQPSTSKLC